MSKIIRAMKNIAKNPKNICIYLNLLGVFNFLPDDKHTRLMWWVHMGKKLDLEHPIGFNEKLQWLKLNDRKELYKNVVDKFEVKKYVAKVLGDEYCIHTIGVWDSFNEIDFEALPSSFVLKTTHDSGGVVIVRNKGELDYKIAKKKLNKSLKRNFFYLWREWPYKDIKPRIIAEEYLVDESGYELKDYKVFVFGGKPYCVQVDYDRFKLHKRNFYDVTWKYLPFTTCYPTDPEKKIEKPECLEELLSCATKLSESLGKPGFLRVDMYVVQGKVVFGEVTFYHGAGLETFYPAEYDYILGDKITLKR